MRCAEALREIDGLQVGGPRPHGSALAEHAAACPDCARALRRQAALLDLLGNFGPVPEAPDLTAAVLRNLRPRWAFHGALRWIAAAALALAALGLGYALGRARSAFEPGAASPAAMMAAYGQALAAEPYGSLEQAYSGLRPEVQSASDGRRAP
jgi:hypothetical protein